MCESNIDPMGYIQRPKQHPVCNSTLTTYFSQITAELPVTSRDVPTPQREQRPATPVFFLLSRSRLVRNADQRTALPKRFTRETQK